MGHAILLVWRGVLMFEGLTGQNRLSIPLRDKCRDSRSLDAIERRSGSEVSGSIDHRDLPVVHMLTNREKQTTPLLGLRQNLYILDLIAKSPSERCCSFSAFWPREMELTREIDKPQPP